MDHLPLKQAPSEFRVPYFEGPMWDKDGPGFWSWPERLGWTFDFLQGELHGKTFDDLQRLVQSWLYFGIIESFTGMDIERSQFIVKASDDGLESEKMWLTSAPLLGIMDAFKEEVQDMADDEKRSRADALLEASRNWVFIAERVMNVLFDYEAGKPLIVSILVLSELLNGEFQEVFQEYDLDWEGITTDSTQTETLFGDCFRARNWCPRAAEIAFSRLQTSTLLYALSLGDYSTARDHRACTEGLCHALQTTPETIGHRAEQHVSSNCNCELVGPDLSSVCQILQDNKIPILEVSEHLDGSIVINVKEYTPGDKYCALSHVWGDRLASAKENRLPECQLRRIVRLMRDRTTHLAKEDPSFFYSTDSDQQYSFQNDLEQDSFISERYIWMDSLCIPSDPRFEQLRNFAVRRMKEIFSYANSVLVLDADMLKLVEDVDPCEMALRLFLSGWAQRLWTLQEAVFNANVFIAMDQYVTCHLEILIRKLLFHIEDGTLYQRSQSSHIHRNLYINVQGSLKEPGFNKADKNRLHFALHAVCFRNTSRAEDEAICIGSFLGLDVERILAVPSGEEKSALKRMQVLIPMISPVPESLLFATGPRLPFEGLSWAPQTLLSPYGLSGLPLDPPPSSSQDSTYPADEPTTSLTENGLHISLPTLQIFLDKYSPNSKYLVLQFGPIPLLVRFQDAGATSEQELEAMEIASSGMLCILCPRTPLETSASGVLVFKTAEYTSHWQARYWRLVELNLVQTESYYDVRKAPRSEGKSVGDAAWIEPTPRWCIS